jgi:hypothetical protein
MIDSKDGHLASLFVDAVADPKGASLGDVHAGES